MVDSLESGLDSSAGRLEPSEKMGDFRLLAMDLVN